MSKWKKRSQLGSSSNISASITSNLIEPKPYKDIIVTKISRAVTYSILIYIIFIFLYVVLNCCNFFAPDVWLYSVFYSFVTLSFWCYLLPIGFLIFFKTILSSKHLLTSTSDDISTLRDLISSLTTKVIFLIVHVVGGAFAVWLYLSLSENHYRALYGECDNNKCLQEGGIFLILNGAWNGLYFYFKTQSIDKTLLFPVIQQSKFQNFKAEFFKIINESKWFTLYPTVYFAISYIALSPIIYQICSELGIRVQHQQFGIALYFFAWVFNAVYVIHSNVFDFLFKLFLTETVEFPLLKGDKDQPVLADALSIDTMPVIQQLACLDLYLLSMWSPQRRQHLYTLSQPGGHPHTWNELVDVILTIINNFTKSLNSNIEIVSIADSARLQSISTYKTCSTSSSINSMPVMQINSTLSNTFNLNETQMQATVQVQETISERFIQVLRDTANYFKNIGIVRQVFGVSRDVTVQDILKFGQSMEFLVLALGNIVLASVNEDPFGVIQRDVPDIITSLLELKIALERVNKSPSIVKKNSSHSTVKMSNSVYSATKRSLIKICRRFKKFLPEFKLKKETIGQLGHMY